MVFILPKSKERNTRLYTLWYLKVKVLAHPRCISAFLFSTGWLCAPFLSLSIHHLQVLPHSRSSVSLGTLFCPQGVQCPLFPFLSPWPLWFPSHSSCSASLSQTYSDPLDLLWEALRSLQCWKISTYFLRGGHFQLFLEVLDVLTRSSNHYSQVDSLQSQAVSAQEYL